MRWMGFHYVSVHVLYTARKLYILVYNSNKMHKSQSLFNPITALRVSAVTVTHLQDHKTTVSTW